MRSALLIIVFVHLKSICIALTDDDDDPIQMCTPMPFERSWTFSFVLIISIFLIVDRGNRSSFEIYGRFERNLFITRDNPMDIRIHAHWWQYLSMPAT